MTKSTKTSKSRQKLQHFFRYASRSLLCIRYVAVAFRSEKRTLYKKGNPVTYFCPALDPPLGGSVRKTPEKDHEYFILTKFHKYASSGSEEVENGKSLRTTTNGPL